MYRNKEIKVRLTAKELDRLNRNVSKTKRPREEYIRRLINGYEPKALPSDEYFLFIRRLWDVHNELSTFTANDRYEAVLRSFASILSEMMCVGIPTKGANDNPERQGDSSREH